MTALYLLGAAVVLIAGLVWRAVRAAKREGAAEAKEEASETVATETVSRVQAGSAAVKAARDQVVAGSSPADIVKANDAKWAKPRARK